MYGKLFTQMYDGTLATKGPWQALITFQQLIILADDQGVVDMTPEAIARRTTIPLEIILAGIKALEQPDPDSRTPDHDGRRIVPLSDTRSWGWHIVNHAHYKAIRSNEERREYMRLYQRARRANVNKTLTSVNNVTDTDTDTDTDTKNKGIVGLTPDPTPHELKGKALRDAAKRVLESLNRNAGRKYEPVDANLKPILARFQEGYSEQDLRAIAAVKARQWKGDEKMEPYIRPKTLFNATNAAQYRAELPVNQLDAQ